MSDQSDEKLYLIDYNDITIKKKLGQGGFGEVHQGIWFGHPVAVKQLLDAQDLSKDAKDEFEKEAKIMAKLKNPNIIQYFGFFISPKYSIVMEYMPKGSLHSVNKTEEPLLWSIRMRIATDMANGLLFLNNKKILHRDIKSLNVLLDENYKAKLCDFGLARVKTETKQNSTIKNTNRDKVGTVQWMAPELFTLKPVFTTKSDIYSLGITFWELAARKIPYYGVDSNIIPALISRGDREEIPEVCPERMAQLIRDCWETNPDKRPDAKTIVERLNEGILSLSTNEFEVLDKEINNNNYLSIQFFYNSNSKTYWIGKCSNKGIVCQKEDGTLTAPDSILEYKEYITLKLYRLFSVKTPDVKLSKQTISKKAKTAFKFTFDEYKKFYKELPSNVPELTEPRLQLMSSVVESFKELGSNFIDFYLRQSKDEYCKVNGVPLKGFGRALAVATYLYDFDCIGELGESMGYVVKDSNADIVKIDASEALPFVDNLSKTKSILDGTRRIKKIIEYEQLNKDDQREFISSAREIIECTDDQLSNVFQEVLLVDGRFREVLKYLKERRTKFLDDCSPVVKELLNKQLKHFQQLLEQQLSKPAEANNNQQNLLNRVDLFKYLDISPGSQKVDDYKSWAIRMRPLPNDEAVCGFGDGSFKIFNMRSGKLVKSVQAHSGRVWDCTMYQNKYLITTSQDKSIKFWDKFGHGSCVKTFTHVADIVSACDISNDKFAVAASDSKVTIWNFNTGKITNNLTGHNNVVQCLVYIQEKNMLASGAGDAVIYIWSLDTFTPLKKLTGHTKLIFDLRKLSNNFLISSCDDYTAKIWDPFSGKCVMTLVGHEHFVNGTSQLSDDYIVTSSEDKTIKIWDYKSGKCLKTISCHRNPVWGMATLNANEEQIHILSGDTKGEMYFTGLKLSSLN